MFSANDGTSGIELWTSNGSSAGAVLVKDINPGAASSSPSELTNLGGTLMFAANNGTSGIELHRNNSSLAGTVLVKNIRSGAAGSAPQYLVNVNGTLYFSADDGVAEKHNKFALSPPAESLGDIGAYG